MSLIELPLPPGVWRNGSKREAKGRYYDCNLIRWKNGKLKPIGGWSNINSTVLDGTPRTLFPFVSLTGVKYLAVGTNTTAYIVPGASNTPDEIIDSNTITLSQGQSTGSSGLGYGAGPFNGTFISKTYTADTISVQASDNSFNDSTATKDFTEYFTVGDYIQVSGFTGGTSSYNKSYPNYHEVTAVTANKLTVSTNLGTDVASGTNRTLEKSRNYGAELFETTTPGLVNTAGIWSFDMLGKYLVGSLDSDGRILYWDSSSPNTNFIVAEVNASDTIAVPINNASVLVSKEGHVFALGAGGEYRKVMFSTQGNFFSIASNNYWTPSSDNTAGSFDLETTGRILSGKKVGNRILVFTDADVHAIDYLGPPYVYSRRKIGDACGAVSKQAIAVVGTACYWMSSAGTFFVYDGVVRPLACEVSNYIKEDYNKLQNSIVYANTLKENNEIWFWYASKDSDEINRYVIYNYAENWWSVGKLIRTAFTDAGVFTRPLAVSVNKKLYEHEFDRDTSTARASSVSDPASLTELSDNDRTLAFGVGSSSNYDTYAETGAVEIGIGERFANLKQFVTDSSAGDNAVTLEVITANNPDSSESSTSTSLSTTGYTDIRVSGRQMRLKVKAPFDQDFEINTLRADVAQGGKR